MASGYSGNLPLGAFTSQEKIPQGYKKGQMQRFTPEQMALFQSLFSHLDPGSYTGRLAAGDEDIFNEIEAPAMRQFQALQGQTGSRFSGSGMGAQKGSGFQNTMNQQTIDFASDLASKRQQLQRQALQDLMGMSGNLLQQQPYEQFLEKKKDKSSFWKSLLAGGSGLAGAGIGAMLGGPAGASIGGSLGSAFGKQFQ